MVTFALSGVPFGIIRLVRFEQTIPKDIPSVLTLRLFERGERVTCATVLIIRLVRCIDTLHGSNTVTLYETSCVKPVALSLYGQ